MKRNCLAAVMGTAFVVLSSLCLTGCSSNGVATKQSVATSTYDQVMKNGQIRCGYVLYDPGCIKDPNTGKLTGVGPESLEKIAKKLGLKIEWTEEVGWGSMLEGLQSGRYDMVVTPVWTNATRAKLCDFSRPLFYSPVCAYTKQGDDRFLKSLNTANTQQVSVATIDGETAEVIAKADFDKCRHVSLPQLTDVSQLLLTVSSGKADITFTEPALAVAFQKHNPNAVVVANASKPIRIFPNCWMYKRNQPEFKNMIDTLIEEIANDGTLEKIVASHEPAPHTLYRVAPRYCDPGPVSPAFSTAVAKTGSQI